MQVDSFDLIFSNWGSHDVRKVKEVVTSIQNKHTIAEELDGNDEDDNDSICATRISYKHSWHHEFLQARLRYLDETVVLLVRKKVKKSSTNGC